MNKSALYTITENGIESYFYSNIAGTLHAPIIAFMGAENFIENNHMLEKVSDAFPLLQFNHLYDHSQNLNGELVFYEIDEEEMGALLSEFCQTDEYGMHITLDLDSDTISCKHNDLCFGDSRLDFSVTLSEGLCCYEDCVDEAANESVFLPAVIEYKMEEKLANCVEQSQSSTLQLNI